ncbi:MAG: hypothetical protein R6X32_06295 [Chloroflexota bacterium]
MSTNETASPLSVAVSQNYWDTAVPLVVDGLTLMALPWLLPAVAPWLQTGRPLNAAVIISIFVFFWLSVFMLKRLAAAPGAAGQRTRLPDWLFTPRVQVILGVAFALALMTGLAHQIGYFDSIFLVDDRELGAGESASFFVLIPGTWLAMTLLYILPLASIPRDRLARRSPWYYVVLLLALLGVNVMLVTAVAELYTLHHLIMRGAGFSLVWLLGSFLLLALLFAPTRLWYWWKVPRTVPLFAFGCLLLYAGSLIAWA